MLIINRKISIAPDEIQESFIRASGPGGQNVNKVASAVQLRFDVANSPSLPSEVKDRLMKLAGSRMTQDGVLIITAQRHRSQERNRQDALDRLTGLVRQATILPKTRRATKPTRSSKERRLQKKTQHSRLKSRRGAKPDIE